MEAALIFSSHYHKYGDELLIHIDTGDETWIWHIHIIQKKSSLITYRQVIP